MKYIKVLDDNFIGKQARTTMSEIKKVMKMIDNQATSQGLGMIAGMTHIEVNAL